MGTGVYDSGGASEAGTLGIDGGEAGDGGGSVYDGGPARWYNLYAPAAPPRYGMQGDPKLILGRNGASLQFRGGQPRLDTGLANQALISLFTRPGWCGNRFMRTHVGSDFEDACDRPITKDSLNLIRMAAEAALKTPIFGRVDVTVTNPSGFQIQVRIGLYPPSSNPQELVMIKNGENWVNQVTGRG